MMWLAAGIISIALSGNRVLSAALDGKLRSSSRVIASRDYELYSVAAVGRHVAFCGNSADIDVDGRTVKLPAGWCLALAFSPDGEKLATGSSEKQVFVFDRATGKSATTLDTKWATAAVAWSPDARMIATGAFNVSLWNADDGTLIRKLPSVGAQLHAVVFSPDGTRVAAVGRDKMVHIWDTATGEVVRTIEPQGFAHLVAGKVEIEPVSLPLTAVDFSPDGKIIATGGADRLVRLWDVETGKELRRFEGHRASITAIRFLHDGKHLVSASLDGTVRFWTAD